MAKSRRECLNIAVTLKQARDRRHLKLIHGGDPDAAVSYIFRFSFAKPNPSSSVSARYHGYVLRFNDLESVPALIVCYKDGNIYLRMRWDVIRRMTQELRTGKQSARQPAKRISHKKRKK